MATREDTSHESKPLGILFSNLTEVNRPADVFRNPWINGLVTVIRAFVYLFGREGTILISSLAFSFFLSIFPIIVLLLTIAQLFNFHHFREAMFSGLPGFFPIAQEFIVRNLRIYTQELGRPQIISVLLIAWAGSTFFFALEAGLDSSYRIKRVRNFVRSQFVGTLMTILAGSLIFLSIYALGNVQALLDGYPKLGPILQALLSLVMTFFLTGVLLSLAYYYLPNRKQSLLSALGTAALASLLWLTMNEVFRTLAPSWSLQRIYGPFYVSVTLLLWAYASGCILLGCARLLNDGFNGKKEIPHKTKEAENQGAENVGDGFIN